MKLKLFVMKNTNKLLGTDGNYETVQSVGFAKI